MPYVCAENWLNFIHKITSPGPHHYNTPKLLFTSERVDIYEFHTKFVQADQSIKYNCFISITDRPANHKMEKIFSSDA